MGQRTGRRIAHHTKGPTSIKLGAMDAAVVVRADDGISVYIPDLDDEDAYPDHVFSVLAFLVAIDDAELRAMMQARLTQHLEAAAEDDAEDDDDDDDDD